MKNLSLILVLISGIIIGCKKDKPIEPLSTNKTIPQWEKLDFGGGDNYRIKAAFVKDNYVYMLSDQYIIKMDSMQHIVSMKRGYTNMDDGLLSKPAFSGKYVAQVTQKKNAVMVYEMENPDIVTLISFDSLSPNYSSHLDAFGQFNNKDELLLSTSYTVPGRSKIIANKLSFSTSGSQLNFQNSFYPIDTTIAINFASRIFAHKENHFIGARYVGTYRLENSNVTAPYNFYINDMINVNDTLYASIFGDNLHGDGLMASYDNGMNWTQVVAGPRLDIFNLHSINGKIILSRFRQLFQIVMNYKDNTWLMRELDNTGILAGTGQLEEITDMFFLGNKVYATTKWGVYFKNISDLEILKEK